MRIRRVILDVRFAGAYCALLIAGCATVPQAAGGSVLLAQPRDSQGGSAPYTLASSPCLTTYDCCIARNSSTPEVCGAPPGTRPLGPTVALVPKPDTATLADTTTAPDAETRELCDSYLKKCNKSWISRVPGSTEGESQCASCYWKCRGLGYWPVRTDDGKACLPF
jgi:hypothetical protein